MPGLIRLDALGANGPYRARNRLTIGDVTGQEVAELSLVPGLYVRRNLAALAKTEPLAPDLRFTALARAARAFGTGTVAGQSAEDYQHTVSRVSGMPISVVRAATRSTAKSLAEAEWTVPFARPRGAVSDWRDPITRSGRAVWVRRGGVFAVQAAGNHPGVHALWPEALALGYRVAVRPSQREPFTPHRLVSALREAGFGQDQVVLLPCDHAVADELIRAAELSIVYGGDDVTRRYAADPTVLPQGPGRSKILLTGENWQSHLDTIVDSVSQHGGAACVNAAAVFVDGDPTPVAEALAERLAAIPSLRPEDDKAVLPVQPVAAARRLEKYLLAHAHGATARLGGDGVVDELGDGSAALRPAVFQVDSPDAPQLGIELAFPCVWVAPWSRSAGIEPLKRTLTLTAITQDAQLVEQLLNEPTIGNVYVGDVPTYWIEPGIPHDGYLADFLMRTKAVVNARRGSEPR